MKNWAVDINKLKKHPRAYRRWRLEQLINYGLDENEKLNEKDLKKYWPQIKENIDPYKKRYLEYLLWQKLYSLPDNLTFWNLPAKKKK